MALWINHSDLAANGVTAAAHRLALEAGIARRHWDGGHLSGRDADSPRLPISVDVAKKVARIVGVSNYMDPVRLCRHDSAA
jgi:hypothetical protein